MCLTYVWLLERGSPELLMHLDVLLHPGVVTAGENEFSFASKVGPVMPHRFWNRGTLEKEFKNKNALFSILHLKKMDPRNTHGML